MSDKVLTKKTPVIFHYRRKDKPARGHAVTVVFNPENGGFGAAVCGKKDNFCKRRGIQIAEGRARTCPSMLLRDDKEFTFDEVKNTSDIVARNSNDIHRLGIF